VRLSACLTRDTAAPGGAPWRASGLFFEDPSAEC
jgi:hypothetical protein